MSRWLRGCRRAGSQGPHGPASAGVWCSWGIPAAGVPARVIPRRASQDCRAPRDEPDHGLRDGQHRCLTAVEHIVPETDLHEVIGVGAVVEHPLVDALVAPAGKDQAPTRTQLVGEVLVEDPPGRVGTTTVMGAGSRSSMASRASPQGSGFITIPAPPP